MQDVYFFSEDELYHEVPSMKEILLEEIFQSFKVNSEEILDEEREAHDAFKDNIHVNKNYLEWMEITIYY